MMQLNRSGAATQPCLTPLEMVNQSERVLLMRTQLDVSVYSHSTTRTILGGMPMEWRMCHRQSRSTESNAALRSMKAMKSARSFRNSRAFSGQSSGIWSVHQTWLKMLVSHVMTASPPSFNSSAVMVQMPDARAFFS